MSEDDEFFEEAPEGYIGLVPKGYDREIVVGYRQRLIHYPEGVGHSGAWCFAHPCVSGNGNGEPCINAPRLDAHSITDCGGDDVTVHPSILCGGCKVHGWVRNGKWTEQ